MANSAPAVAEQRRKEAADVAADVRRRTVSPTDTQSTGKGTPASDGSSCTVGWIVRNFDYEGRAPWDYTPNILSSAERPYPAVANLDPNTDFELVWFDDRRGTIICRVDDPFAVEPARLPDTEPGGGFGKSVAFLIQPAGFTPERTFAELPNEPIGQITLQELEGTENWHEERPTALVDVSYSYGARIRVANTPLTYPDDYYFQWSFEDGPQDPVPVAGTAGGNLKVHGYGSTYAGADKKVSVDIYTDAAGLERVCGDVIFVRVKTPTP